jgi:hypothetical protein
VISKRARIRRQLRKNRALAPKQLAGCTGKIRYDSYHDAKLAADRVINAHAYKCLFCQFYHKGRKRL